MITVAISRFTKTTAMGSYLVADGYWGNGIFHQHLVEVHSPGAIVDLRVSPT